MKILYKVLAVFSVIVFAYLLAYFKLESYNSSQIEYLEQVDRKIYPTNDFALSPEDCFADSENTISTKQKTYLFESRRGHNKTFLTNKNSFRVVSYNVLADFLARFHFGKRVRKYAYCPECALEMNYRLPLLQKEIQGYHGDILCFQEVDQFVYDDHISPAMAKLNFASEFDSKPNRTEGLAMFYNKLKFSLISTEKKTLRDALVKDFENTPVSKLALNNPKFKKRLLNHGATVLFLVLRFVEEPSRHLVVANTHVHAPVNANHARIVQIAVVLKLLEEKLLKLRDTINKDDVVSYVLCGDFNAPPQTGVVDYILSGKISPIHSDWYPAGWQEYHGTDISLSHNLKFSCATGFPKYTFYAEDYVDCIDYVFVNPDHVKVDKVLEPPAHELVTKYTGLPSVIAPSDHIAQVVDLSWNTEKNYNT